MNLRFKPEQFKDIIKRFEEKSRAGWVKDSLEEMLCQEVNDTLAEHSVLTDVKLVVEDLHDGKGAYP